MEQILWERGWIDPTLARKVYTVYGTKDSMGAVRKDTSLQYLMSNLKDFETQETSMLCLKAREIGIMIDRTPKCHCKLAGEGIEYAWGCAKNQYRRQPLKHKKRQKDNFRQTEKMFFMTSSHNRASTTVFTVSPSIHSCLSQDLTRPTHLVVNDRFGQHCLSSKGGKDAEEVQDT
jgi:hypothetical protein